MAIDDTTGWAMMSMYDAGLTADEIARVTGCDESTVRRHLVKVGVSMRRRGPRLRPDVLTETIVSLREDEGLSFREIADCVDMGRKGTGVRARYRRAKGLPVPR